MIFFVNSHSHNEVRVVIGGKADKDQHHVQVHENVDLDAEPINGETGQLNENQNLDHPLSPSCHQTY